MGTAPTRQQFTAQIGVTVAGGGSVPVERPDGPRLGNLAGGAAFVVDRDLRCLVAEGDAMRFANLRTMDVVGRRLADVVDPVLAAWLEPQCRLALAGVPGASEHAAAAHAYLTRSTPLHDGEGAIYAALIVAYDISERAHLETLRRQGEETFAALIDHAPFGVCVVDGDFRLRAANQAAEPLFGGIEPPLGHDVAAILQAIGPEDIAADAIARFRHTLATGEPYVAPRVAATERPVGLAAFDWRIQRLTLPDGTLGVVCYAYDLTAIREAESRLRDADRRKDEFLAVLAHELRNPLAPIRAGLELIRLGGDQPGAVERVRTMMERQVGQMVRLIDDLLDVSRIASGKIRLQRQPVPLAALVTPAIDAHRSALMAGHLTLEVSLPSEPVIVDVDATRGIQVLSNVLHNAVKFTEPGGRITISAAIEAAPADAAAQVAITIADTGVGIGPELLPRLFDLYTQGRADAGARQTGLGIGLALARRLVDMQGGSICVHSDGAGRGSAFTIRLPLAFAVPEPSTSAAPVVRVPRRVGIVDDHRDAGAATAMLLAELGADVRVASDGAGGIAEVLAWRPDLVLLDLGMPGLDGYEACRRIRAELGASIVIVALSGWGQTRDKAESARAGFDGHLTKPADPSALARLLGDGRPYLSLE
jgi:signal transduction histidine kinase